MSTTVERARPADAEIGADARPSRSTALRVLLLLVVALALALPLSYVFLRFWISTTEGSDRAGLERHGVAYVQPLTALLNGLVSAQSATIRGTPVDAATVQAALAAVDTVDRERGSELGTQARWNALRPRVLHLVEQPLVADRASYTAYSETVDLVLDLIGKLGDTSGLALDPDLDSYYLMDTALRRLPVMLVDASRAADLAQLGRAEQPPGNDSADSNGSSNGGSQAAQAAAQTGLQVAVARDRVATAAQAISAGLQKSLAGTSSSTLAPNVIGQLDSFLAAAGGLAPTTTLVGPQDLRPDPSVIGPARDRLQQSAIQLEVATLGELDGLVRARVDGFDTQRVLAVVAVAISVLVGAGLLWFRPPLLRTATTADDDVEIPAAPAAPARIVPDGVATDLVDARALLDAGELVRIGRAVRPIRREHTDDPG